MTAKETVRHKVAPSVMNSIDYRSLLQKYIKHVIASGGVSFISSHNPEVHFSPIELTVLEELERAQPADPTNNERERQPAWWPFAPMSEWKLPPGIVIGKLLPVFLVVIMVVIGVVQAQIAVIGTAFEAVFQK